MQARAPGLEESRPVAGEGVGAMAWSRALELGDSQALHAAVAPNGDVLLVAAYGRPIDLGGGPLPFDRAARGPHLMVARFSPEGALRWARGMVPHGSGEVHAQVGAVGVDRDGAVLLGGTSAGFQLRVPRRTRLRLVLAQDQAGTCYATSRSGAIRA